MEDKLKYYLAINYGCEGWSFEKFETLDELKGFLLLGGSHGKKFGEEIKVLKELDINFEIKEQ